MTFFLSWLCAFLLTWAAIPLLTRIKVLDNPISRSNHTHITPRGGGIAIVLPAALFLSLAGIDNRIIFALLGLAAMSFMDDMRTVKVRWRLIAQLSAVIIALPALHGKVLPFLPATLEAVLLTLGWIWYINLTNFMDGIDGITSLQVIMMCVGIDILGSLHSEFPATLTLYASIIAAATLGFFWFNRSPARIFLGDTGSVALGFLMGYLLLELAAQGFLASALILPAYYLTDSGVTLIKRCIKGEKVWQAHSQHAYQQAVRGGMTHSQVVRRITGVNSLLILLAAFASLSTGMGIIILLVAYGIIGSFIFWLPRFTANKKIN